MRMARSLILISLTASSSLAAAPPQSASVPQSREGNHSMNIPEEDRQVLQQLAEHGDDPRIVRPVVHWLFGNEADLRELGRRLADRGWTDTEPKEDDDGWLISPAKRSDLSAEAIIAMNNDINQASNGLDVDHDGWETSVEQSK